MADQKISELNAKTTPADTDLVALVDIAAAPDETKKVTWANIKATLKTYFDTLYATVGHTHAQLHTRLHSITSTLDHSSGATSGQILKADANGLPVDGSNTDTEVADAVTKKHTQGTDTALGAVGTKNPPINADKALYRDSAASDALVTSTWTQIKAFLKTYFDTIYAALSHKTRHENGGADEINVGGLSGLLADDQHVLDAEVVAAVKAGNYVPRTYVWFVSGTVATGTEQGPTFRMKRATIVEDIELHVKTAPTGAALIVDINEAGTTLFSTKPEIDISGTTEDDNHVFSGTNLAAAAELTMDIDQVGSTIAGADLTVLLHCKELVI